LAISFNLSRKLNISLYSNALFLISQRVICATPTRSSLRPLMASQQSLPEVANQGLIARLSVVKAIDAAVLASANFTFFDCHQLQSCQECSSSRFPCDWCALSAKCVPNAEDVCQGEPLVNSISVCKSNFEY
jgi:hypothetical protein